VVYPRAEKKVVASAWVTMVSLSKQAGSQTELDKNIFYNFKEDC
jgi:hypothetical protein